MRGRQALLRVVTATAVCCAFGSVAFVMAATFAATADPSGLTRIRWGLLAIWTLALPPLWGLRTGRRLRHLAVTSDLAGIRAASRGLWLEFGAVGLGAAVAALAIIRA